MKNLINALLILPLLFLTSCNDDDTNETDGLKYMEELNLAYGADGLQKMDVYLPKNRTSQTRYWLLCMAVGFLQGKKKTSMCQF